MNLILSPFYNVIFKDVGAIVWSSVNSFWIPEEKIVLESKNDKIVVEKVHSFKALVRLLNEEVFCKEEYLPSTSLSSNFELIILPDIVILAKNKCIKSKIENHFKVFTYYKETRNNNFLISSTVASEVEAKIKEVVFFSDVVINLKTGEFTKDSFQTYSGYFDIVSRQRVFREESYTCQLEAKVLNPLENATRISGYGIDKLLERAKIKAQNELIERMALFGRLDTIDHLELSNNIEKVYLDSFKDQDALKWVVVKDLQQKKYLLPSFLFSYVDESYTHFLNSGGFSTHINLQKALEHGLLELLEKDAIRTWWYGCLVFPQIFFENDEVRSFSLETGREVHFFDLNMYEDVKIIACVSYHNKGMKNLSIGSCAAWSYDEALVNSFGEMRNYARNFEESGERHKSLAPTFHEGLIFLLKSKKIKKIDQEKKLPSSDRLKILKNIFIRNDFRVFYREYPKVLADSITIKAYSPDLNRIERKVNPYKYIY